MQKIKTLFLFKSAEKSVKLANWYPTETDYVLLFMDVDGEWREVSHNIPRFGNMLLADYLQLMDIYVPDYCQFMRIINYERNFRFVWHAHGGRIRIDVNECYGY